MRILFYQITAFGPKSSPEIKVAVVYHRADVKARSQGANM
jgi:hypothetical protein